MRKIILAASLALATCAPMAAPAQSANDCASTATVKEFHASNKGEVPRLFGIINDTLGMEFLANDETGTWSVIITDIAKGMSCFASGGTGWTFIDAMPLGVPG